MIKDYQQTDLLKTTQAAVAAGITRQTLQYYLMVGLIEPTSRTASGQQLFDKAAVKRIKLIHQINESGYPLREIRNIFLQHLHPASPVSKRDSS